MTCPRCGGEEWKLASFVHKEGVSHVDTKTAGIALSKDGVGFGAASTAGLMRSQLSKEAAQSCGLPSQRFVFAALVLQAHTTWLPSVARGR